MTSRADLLVGLVLAAIGGACFLSARNAPAPGVDPLGPGTVPLVVSLIVVALSAVMIAKAAAGGRRGRSDEQVAEGRRQGASDAAGADQQGPAFPLFSLPLVVVAGLTLAYVGSLAFLRLPYWLATLLFAAGAVWTLSGWRLRSLPKALLAGALLGVGCAFVFTQVFVVDLP